MQHLFTFLYLLTSVISEETLEPQFRIKNEINFNFGLKTKIVGCREENI